MHLDVVDLKAFYYRTRLGRVAQRAVCEKVREFWPESKGETVAGFGFAAPILRPYLKDSRRVICLMPGQQGVMPWPDGQPNISLLTEETNWPLQTGFVDKLVVMHGLETSEDPARLLDEIWRVMTPGGRVMFIVPNRSGMWSSRDATPFGFGRPYSLRQLEAQLKKHRFLPESHVAALFSPPSQKRFWLKMSPMLERVGQAVSSHLAGGVLLVEASKQIYAPTPKGLPEAVKRPLGVLKGVGRPKPEPASGRSGAL
ncbi:MAG: SAM-dependent methyltransferase [Paracoccaceae bacterium]|jgi:SAM-dependent methyltransferase